MTPYTVRREISGSAALQRSLRSWGESNSSRRSLMPRVYCEYCHAVSDSGPTSGCCDTCGRKLPTEACLDPLAVLTRSYSQAARKALNQVSGVVFTVAALQLIFGTIALVAVPNELHPHEEILVDIFKLEFCLGLWFAGLGIGARYQPLPLTIIGVVSYITVIIAEVYLAPQVYTFIYGKSLAVVLLIMSVQFANRYNRLQRLVSAN